MRLMMVAKQIDGIVNGRRQPRKRSSIADRSRLTLGGPDFVILLCSLIAASLISEFTSPVQGAQVRMLSKKHDPYGAPRPAMGQENVPLLTTFYAQLTAGDDSSSDEVLPESVSITLKADDGEAFAILEPGPRFTAGYSGRLFPGKRRKERTLEVYVDSQRKFKAATTYTIQVQARSRGGGELSSKAGTWQFTTEAAGQTHSVEFDLSLDAAPVTWTGAFFSGFCKPSFCTSSSNRIGRYELMQRVRQTSPRAWSLQRDFWMTGMDDGPKLLSPQLPGIVRERETRRITAIQQQDDDTLLHVEDFFGHEQYGIAANRPLSDDYQPGHEVLIADGTSDARVTVVGVDDKARTVRVTRPRTPEQGWKLEYSAPLPKKEDPDSPGLFPPGGCFLKKFQPSGTPAYYWGRLDHEWDIAHRQFKRRLMPNFADAPGDLSIDGRNWTTAKDYAELHEVVRMITGHIIDRYGDAALDFPWSVFNEPDLGALFWRSDWTELQKFYDYTVDGILRAFEDRGYDSNRVMVGGLELGGIFGHLRIQDFLVHCSPRADAAKAAPTRKGQAPTLVLLNAAFANRKLDGKRSQRVESLCRKHNGYGSPCDFVSIHAYNTSQRMADKLIRAKEIALYIDPEYYAGLWVNSYESCPGWNMPPDPAFGDSYLGNGYFPTWCVDVIRRQLQAAADDSRFGFGESILTFWPWPNANFSGGNACTRVIHIDNDADGRADRSATVAMPILHFLGLTNRMGNQYLVLPERTIGAHSVSGIASRTDNRTQLVIYSHAPLDTESRSEQKFEILLNLSGVAGRKAHVTEYRFDKDHNSYFRLARSLREQRIASTSKLYDEAKQRVRAAIRKLESGEKPTIQQALQELSDLGPAANAALASLFVLAQNSPDGDIRAKATETAFRLNAREAYSPDVLRQVEELSTLRSTATSLHSVDAEGCLQLNVSISGNGANVVVIEHDK